jgi:hypothetical protein
MTRLDTDGVQFAKVGIDRVSARPDAGEPDNHVVASRHPPAVGEGRSEVGSPALDAL